MEESEGIEPRWLSPSPRFSGALGDRSPALSLEHPAAVETANTWVAITSLLLFAFGCIAWYPARDSNSEYPDPKSGGFDSFPSRANLQNLFWAQELVEGPATAPFGHGSESARFNAQRLTEPRPKEAESAETSSTSSFRGNNSYRVGMTSSVAIGGITTMRDS